MNRYEFGRRYRRNRMRRKILRCLAGLLCAGAIGAGGWFAVSTLHGQQENNNVQIARLQAENEDVTNTAAAGANTDGTTDGSAGMGTGSTTDGSGLETATLQSPLELLLARADTLALGYDYDAAIALLQNDTEYSTEPAVQSAIADYEATKAALIRVDVTQVTHVFFHSLIVDPAKAFDGDADQDGFNQVMTTVSEFKKIIRSMYDRGFVLVSLHDLACESTDENGNTVMKAGDILLPEGKTPFVMSQDDLCYYIYMDGDGFASRMVIGEDGKPTCEMTLEDGSTVTGAYDLVPILEEFIQEHPDFSYRGARAVLAFTGYQGILGYRTAYNYADSDTYEQDKQTATKVAQCLRDNGWELASHSWGHLNLGEIEMERFREDTDKWKDEVESLIGPTDIILFPFGTDIGDWHPYSSDNERYAYLYEKGFRYFCNVDSSRYWVQLNGKCFRQGRRNLDGYRMWKDITAEAEGRERKLEDIFHAEDVFDEARPTPVPDL